MIEHGKRFAAIFRYQLRMDKSFTNRMTYSESFPARLRIWEAHRYSKGLANQAKGSFTLTGLGLTVHRPVISRLPWPSANAACDRG